MIRKSSLVLLCLVVLAPAVSAFAGLDPSLVAWWAFDEGSGTIAYDGSGNGNDGTLQGGPLWVPGVLGTALDFTGTNSYVAAPTIPFDSRSFTQAMWVNPGLVDSEEVVFAQHQSGSTNLGLHYRIYNTGVVRMGFYSNDLDTGALLEADTWYHLTFWYDYENLNRRIYINGEMVAEGGSDPFLGTGAETRIGQWNNNQWFNGSVDDVQVYSRPLLDGEVVRIMSGLADLSLAQNIYPLDEAIDIPRDAVLEWGPGQTAVAHDVYFGTSFEDVNDGVGTLVSQGQADTTYDPDGLLEFGQMYYWRVDEVNGAPDNTIFKGEVWSFTVEPFAYPVANVVATSNGVSEAGFGPERTIDGSGLNADDQHSMESEDMWLAIPGADPLMVQYDFDSVYKLHELLIWNYNVQFEPMLGFGIKDATIEYSADGETWTLLGDVELAQAAAMPDYTPNTTVAFEGVPVQHVRLTVNSGYGPLGQFGLSEVRFMFIPAQAREPQPDDGDTGVLVGTDLTWRAGREAVTHDVYLATDPEALALVDSVGETSYTPGNLEFGLDYYWRIDEVNETDAVSVWEGPLWSFSTQEYAVIDDMESYDDEENRIFDVWLDGFVNGTGSTVGYFEAPFAEKAIVNSGGQSMPLAYDNSIAPFYSEAELDLGTMNLTGNGADTLRLHISGLAPAFTELADGTILMNAIGADIWDIADECRYAYKQLTGDGSMVVRVDALDSSPNTWAKAGVMIRDTDAVGSTHSFMCMTGGSGNGASWQGRPTENAASENNDATSPVAPPYWVRIDRSGDTLTGFLSPDGQDWTQLGDARTIAMGDPVLIGLALTSHNANQATSAKFSNVSFTGSVAGDWQIAEIGVAQPEGNDPAPVYVALEDASGGVAVVTYPDPDIAAMSGWTEWLIPYTDLAGVNLSRAAILYVGVGDPDNPTAGGAGTIFVDDIGYGRPAASQ
jgi:hypothetical protein